MKKIVCIFLILFSFLSVSYAQSYIIGVPELQGSPKYLKTYSERLTAQQRYIKTDTLAKYVADYVLSDSSIFHRNNHTGSQLISTIKNLQTSLDGKLSLMSEKLRINGLGNVGIGTTAPLQKLHVVSTSAYNIQLERSGVGSALIGLSAQTTNSTGDLLFDMTQASQGFAFRSRNSSNGVINALGIDRDGKVGVQTFNPTHDFHVNGTSRTNRLLVNTGVDNGLDVAQFNGSVSAIYLDVTNNASFGNVSIGTTNPHASNRLQINTSGFEGTPIGFGSVDDSPRMKMYRPTGGGEFYPIAFGSETNGNMAFYTGNTAALGSETVTPKMVITLSGLVGIGTNNPLRSKVNISSVNTTQGSNNYGLFIETSDSQAADIGGSVGLGGQIGGGDRNAFAVISGRKESSTSGSYAGYMAFATPDGGATMSEKARINSQGLFAVGTVNPFLSVDVRKTSPYTYNRASIGGMSPDGLSHGYMLIPPNEAGFFDIVRSNNTDLRFATETSLGVGFSTQATLTSTGRFAIKTASPTHDLHVNGTSRTDKLLVNTGVDNGVDVGQFNGSVNIAGALKSVGTHTITSSSTSDDATLTLYQSGSNYWHIKNVAPSGQLHFVRGTSTFGRINQAGQWSIGQNEVANTAILDVQSTTKGFLPPRMTTAQRNAIASPAEGLMIYQTDNTKGWYGYNGSAWVQL
jgi:hypothetical protein